MPAVLSTLPLTTMIIRPSPPPLLLMRSRRLFVSMIHKPSPEETAETGISYYIRKLQIELHLSSLFNAKINNSNQVAATRIKEKKKK
jgi:hypothetical protein